MHYQANDESRKHQEAYKFDIRKRFNLKSWYFVPSVVGRELIVPLSMNRTKYVSVFRISSVRPLYAAILSDSFYDQFYRFDIDWSICE